MKGHRRVLGMTMIELLVTISIAAILAAMAIPAFNNMLTSNRAQAQAGLLFRSLNYARTEAVRRAARVVVKPLSGSDWTQGWRVWVDTDGDDVLDSGEDELQHQDALTGSPSITATASSIKFIPSGYISDTTTTGFTATDRSFLYVLGTTSSYCTRVSYGGRVSFEKKSTCP